MHLPPLPKWLDLARLHLLRCRLPWRPSQIPTASSESVAYCVLPWHACWPTTSSWMYSLQSSRRSVSCDVAPRLLAASASWPGRHHGPARLKPMSYQHGVLCSAVARVLAGRVSCFRSGDSLREWSFVSVRMCIKVQGLSSSLLTCPEMATWSSHRHLNLVSSYVSASWWCLLHLGKLAVCSRQLSIDQCCGGEEYLIC